MRVEGVLGQAVDRIGGVPIGARMERKAPQRHIDPTLLFATAALAIFGAVMVYSATVPQTTTSGVDPSSFVKRQIVFAVLGILTAAAISSFDYGVLRSLAPVLYLLTVVALAIVISPLGEQVAGAQRWVSFGPLQVQPSEFAKMSVIVAAAGFIASRQGNLGTAAVMLTTVILGVPTGLILMQPDLGTVMVFLFVSAAMLLVGGAKIRHFMALLLIGLMATVAVAQTGMIKDYQRDRLTAFLDPSPDLRSEGYNLAQSKIAIASGGLRGRGLGAENTQTSLAYVPEQHTDFIFTAVGEQLGFLGSASLLGLLALMIWRALRIAAMSRDLFGTLIACGIAAVWSFQVFVNVGMTMGIMPITGIPLPFISFGGSSMLANFVGVGLLLNIHMRRQL